MVFLSDFENKRSVSVDRLEYDVLEAVSKPLTNVDDFAGNVLDCFERNIESTSYLFYRYENSRPGSREISVTGQVAKGLPEELYGDKWKNNHFKTSIYHPERNKTLLGPDGGLLTLKDVISLEDYERSRNYREIIAPYGLYYSFSAYIAHEGKLLGHISLCRSKETGDFDEFDLQRVKKVLSAVRDKLVDYERYQSWNSGSELKKMFSGFVNDKASAAMVLESSGRLLFCNDRMLEFAVDMYNESSPEASVYKVCDALSSNLSGRYSIVRLEGHGGRSYSCSLSPCGVFVEGTLKQVYLVQITGEKLIELPVLGMGSGEKLTERQMEIVQMMAKGMSTKEIASAMCVTEGTVRKHVENIRVTLGVNSRMAILKKLNFL